MVGLWDHRRHRLAQLSGGQQQRIAIALALANRPKLLLGDEPTGEVDSATAKEILALFEHMNAEYGLTTIIVTHDPQIARVVDRVVTIRDGRTSSEAVRRVAEVEAALVEGAVAEIEDGRFRASLLEEFVVVDDVGRLQIPPELREKSGIGQRVTLESTEDGVLIRPASGSQDSATPAVHSEQDDPPQRTPRRGLRRWFGREKK